MGRRRRGTMAATTPRSRPNESHCCPNPPSCPVPSATPEDPPPLPPFSRLSFVPPLSRYRTTPPPPSAPPPSSSPAPYVRFAELRPSSNAPLQRSGRTLATSVHQGAAISPDSLGSRSSWCCCLHQPLPEAACFSFSLAFGMRTLLLSATVPVPSLTVTSSAPCL